MFSFFLAGSFVHVPAIGAVIKSEASLLYHDDSAAASVPFIPVILNGTRHGLRR
jgi:hypothetical protein